MNSINEILKLKILSGKPILLQKCNCFFIHRTLEEIIDFGLDEFYKVVQVFKISNKELADTFDFPIDNFFYFLLNLNNQTQLSSIIQKGFYFFLDVNNIHVDMENKILFCDYKEIQNIEINQEAFNEIIEYINIIYEGDNEEEDNDDNLSEAERRMKEKFKKAKLARDKAKAKKEGTTQFSDLMGGFWTKSGMTWSEVLKLPYYTFYFLLERLKITDNYETQLRCMLAGADMKDKPLHHWLQGQSNDED